MDDSGMRMLRVKGYPYDKPDANTQSIVQLHSTAEIDVN